MQPGFRGAPSLTGLLGPHRFLGAPGPRTHSSHGLFLKKVGASFEKQTLVTTPLLCASCGPRQDGVPFPGSGSGVGGVDSTAIPACWEGRGHLTWMRGALCTPAGHAPTDAAGAPRAPPGHQEGQGRERKQGPGLMLTQPGDEGPPCHD